MENKFNPKYWQGRRKDQVESNYIIVGISAVIAMEVLLAMIIYDTFKGIFW